MLISKEWLIVIVMNRALALLQKRNFDNGKKYWIFNTYIMDYLMCFQKGIKWHAGNLYKCIPGGISLNMSAYIVHVILEMYTGHW